jgi:hypothetical protein
MALRDSGREVAGYTPSVVNDEPSTAPEAEALADEIRLELLDLDMRTDAELWAASARFAPLAQLHGRADAELGPEHPLTRALFWETVLSNQGIDGNRRPGTDTPRYPHIDSRLTQPEALDLLSGRASSPSAVVRAHIGDLIWEYGGKQRRRFALAAPTAMLEVARSLEPADDELADATRTAVIEDCLERGTELALAMNQSAVVRAIVSTLLEVLQQAVDLSRWHRVMCLLPAITLLARRMTPDERLQVDGLLQAAEPIFRAHPNASNPYLTGQLLEARRTVALAKGELSEAAAIDVAQAEVWSQHAETVPGLSGSHFLRGAIELLERAGGQTDRLNNVKLRLRAMTLDGIKREVKVMTWRAELPDSWIAELQRAAAQPAPQLLSTLAEASGLRVTAAACEELHRQAQTLAPASTLFPATLLRSEAAHAPLSGPSAEHAREARDLLSSTAWWLRIILTEMRDRRDLSADDLLKNLRQSGNFREENLGVIAVGLERAMSGDNISALHILVPQLEDVLRALLPRVGIDTMVPGRELGTTQEMTLGQILPRLTERGVMSEDDHFLFSLVLEDPAGDNLRNDVAHGLLRVGLCTDDRVGRIL